jgi:hypothetical protein
MRSVVRMSLLKRTPECLSDQWQFDNMGEVIYYMLEILKNPNSSLSRHKLCQEYIIGELFWLT